MLRRILLSVNIRSLICNLQKRKGIDNYGMENSDRIVRLHSTTWSSDLKMGVLFTKPHDQMTDTVLWYYRIFTGAISDISSKCNMWYIDIYQSYIAITLIKRICMIIRFWGLTQHKLQVNYNALFLLDWFYRVVRNGKRENSK